MTAVHTKLGEICIVRRGTTITKKQTIEGDVPVIGGGTKPTYFHNESNRKANCITISGSGASAGFVNKWDVPIFASDCSTVEPKDNTQLSEFIYYFLLSQQEYIYKNFRSGAAQPHVYAKDIETLEYPILSITEQQRIVVKLDAAFAEIDRAFQLINDKQSELENLKISVINNIFQALSNERKMGEVFEFVRGPFGGSLKKSCFVEAGFAVYEQQHAINNQCSEFRYFVTQEKYNEMSRFSVTPNSILMSCSGTIGKTTIIPANAQRGIINQALLMLKPNDEILPKFTTLYMDSKRFSEQLLDRIDGAAQQNVASVKVLKEIKIPLPNINEQNRLVSHMEKILSGIDSTLSFVKSTKQNYIKLKSSILTKELVIDKDAA